MLGWDPSLVTNVIAVLEGNSDSLDRRAAENARTIDICYHPISIQMPISIVAVAAMALTLSRVGEYLRYSI